MGTEARTVDRPGKAKERNARAAGGAGMVGALAVLVIVCRAGAGDLAHYCGDGSWAAPDVGPKRVDAAAQAELVWSSEAKAAAMGWSSEKSERPGGFGVSVVTDGRVYVGVATPPRPAGKPDASSAGAAQGGDVRPVVGRK
jgi:hypothetical protein